MHTLPLKDLEFNGKGSIGSVNLGPILERILLNFRRSRHLAVEQRKEQPDNSGRAGSATRAYEQIRN